MSRISEALRLVDALKRNFAARLDLLQARVDRFDSVLAAEIRLYRNTSVACILIAIVYFGFTIMVLRR